MYLSATTGKHCHKPALMCHRRLASSRRHMKLEGNSADYKAISKLSDKDLIQRVLRPNDYRKVTINTETGKLFNGNTRIYKLQTRNFNRNVPYKEYTPDNSMFPQLKEPPKTK